MPTPALAAQIERILPRVAKPTRYTGGEYNAVVKDHQAVDVLFAWCFPDSYEVGMSHLGSLIMYDAINRRADAACERVYCPWPDMEAELRAAKLPLFTLETWSPVGDFDYLGFPLLYELTYTGVLTMLDLAGVPLLAAERDDRHPVVLGGGPCASNPEPVAPFFDAVVVGDGEAVIGPLIRAMQEWKAGGRRDRQAFLQGLAALQGVYVPGLYAPRYHPDGRIAAVTPLAPGAPERVVRATVADLDAVDFPTAPVVPNMDIVFERAQVEVFRGCTRGCRFCHAGMVSRPVRERSPEKVRRIAAEMMQNTGYNEMSLVSLSTADWSDVRGTVKYLAEEMMCTGVNVSLPSTRVDAFSVDLADSLRSLKKGSLTLAPEGGSQRMRDIINKDVGEADIENALSAAFAAGYRSLKLYFIIGLPFETDDDVIAIARLAHNAVGLADRLLGRAEARRVKVTVSASVFVPKPHTPFQFEPLLDPPEVRRRQQLLRRRIRDRRIQYKYHGSEESRIEAVLSRGDRRVARVIQGAWQRGARFDGWSECFRPEAWQAAFSEAGLDPEFYTSRPIPYDEVLPWDHIFAGVTRAFLVRDHRRARAAQVVDDCRWHRCDGCGACPVFGVWPTLKQPVGDSIR